MSEYGDNILEAGKTLGWSQCVVCKKQRPGFHENIDQNIAYPQHEDDCPIVLTYRLTAEVTELRAEVGKLESTQWSLALLAAELERDRYRVALEEMWEKGATYRAHIHMHDMNQINSDTLHAVRDEFLRTLDGARDILDATTALDPPKCKCGQCRECVEVSNET